MPSSGRNSVLPDSHQRLLWRSKGILISIKLSLPNCLRPLVVISMTLLHNLSIPPVNKAISFTFSGTNILIEMVASSGKVRGGMLIIIPWKEMIPPVILEIFCLYSSSAAVLLSPELLEGLSGSLGGGRKIQFSMSPSGTS